MFLYVNSRRGIADGFNQSSCPGLAARATNTTPLQRRDDAGRPARGRVRRRASSKERGKSVSGSDKSAAPWPNLRGQRATLTTPAHLRAGFGEIRLACRRLCWTVATVSYWSGFALSCPSFILNGDDCFSVLHFTGQRMDRLAPGTTA